MKFSLPAEVWNDLYTSVQIFEVIDNTCLWKEKKKYLFDILTLSGKQ